MIARSRAHLLSMLESHFGGAAAGANGGGDGGRPKGAVPVKTYLLEGRGPRPPAGGEHPDPFVVLSGMDSDPVLHDMYGPRVHRAEDPDLATIEVTDDAGRRAFLYVDWEDPRHWLLHTAAVSALADRFVSLAASRFNVGRVHVPSEFLEEAAALGSTVALTLRHERRLCRPGAAGRPADFVKARIWGTRAGRMLAQLRGPGGVAGGIALSSVRVRHRPHAGDRGAYCVDDLRWDGRILARGNSLAAHLEVTAALQRCYVRQVDAIESRHAVRMSETDGIMRGTPLTLRLSRPVEDLAELCGMVFSSTSPFLLWGQPVARSSACIGVAAVDLNFGHPLAFEFTPEFVRLFLPRETTGGTVVRFYANLQHHLDARARLLDQDKNGVFQP